MRKVAILIVLALGVSLGSWSTVRATNSDFALFDGTNPANQPGSGAVCGAAAGGSQNPTFFTYHVSVSNWSDSLAVLRITFSGDGDFTRYQIPARSSFSLTGEGGSNANNSALRFSVEENGQLAGEASATGPKVFCISCDADSDGAAACNKIIQAGGLGTTGSNK